MVKNKLRFMPVVAALLLAVSCTGAPEPASQNQVAQNTIYLSPNTQGSVANAPDNPSNNRFTVYLTGYSYWDNTPRRSTAIATPVIHNRAGGTGTYADPVTLAVGHVIQGGRHTMDFPAGTRFYIERLKKYAIVEDQCGDGNRPQNGPCHSGHRGHAWIDIYVGGKKSSETAARNCTYRVTGLQSVVLDPHRDYPVSVGELTASGCQTF